MADVHSERNPLDEIAEEFVALFRAGRRPSLSAYTNRFPELADDIRELFPALVLMEKVRPEPGDAAAEPAAAEPGTAELPARLRALGDFRILREIGRGGMGVVYEAEQISLGRRVALKVLPAASHLDPRRLQRFRREAKAAAGLHHTNIVPVYGVGEHDDVHFIVMQMIPGLGLDQVVDELHRLRDGTPAQDADAPPHALAGDSPLAPLKSGDLQGGSKADSSATLPGQPEHSPWSGTGRPYWNSVARIGVQVARALAYAHAQGIQHRDVKPSNLLLDAQGTVWVTDFGLAKQSDDQDHLTHTGDVVGTLRYLAPERLAGHGDARSDLCSLGLTLYELLTLTPAYPDGDRARLVQHLERDEPTPPSSYNAAIPRDLETVVLKAMARDAAQRYPSADELADDLERYLDDQPIRARRSSVRERATKWVRRHPTVAVLTACVVATALAGLGGILWQWRNAVAARNDAIAALTRENEALAQARHDRQRAEEEATKARHEADASRDVAEVLMGLFQQSDPWGLSGYLINATPGKQSKITTSALLDAGADKVLRELGDKPDIQAKLLEAIGGVYLSMGDMDKGASVLNPALALRRRHCGPESLESARCLAGLGVVHFVQGREDEAHALFAQATRILEKTMPDDDPHLRAAQLLLAFIKMRRDENEPHLRDMEAAVRRFVAIEDPHIRPRDLTLGLSYVGAIWYRRGDLIKATALFTELAEFTDDIDQEIYRLFRIRIPYGLRKLLAGDEKDATRIYRGVTGDVRTMFGERHPLTYFIEQEFGRIFEAEKRWAMSETFFRDALASARKSIGRQPRTAMAMEDLARVLRKCNKHDEARDLLDQALALRRSVQGPDHPDAARLKSDVAVPDAMQRD
jgi:serine/threonine protein kinase